MMNINFEFIDQYLIFFFKYINPCKMFVMFVISILVGVRVTSFEQCPWISVQIDFE